MTRRRGLLAGGRRVMSVGATLLVLIGPAAGCGDGSADDGDPPGELERPAGTADVEAAADPGDDRARESAATPCRLGPWSPAGPGLRVRLPQAGITLPGWTIGAVRGDRQAAMAEISDDGALPAREVEAPAGPVYYTVEELKGREGGAAAYRVRVAFRNDGDWYRAGLPIQGPDRDQVESCLALMPEALATLSSTD